jgi:Replication-relaxation
MLGPKGCGFVRGEGEAGPRVPRGSLDHHLSIVETWVSLATLELPGVGLQLARADWELRTEFGGALPIVPDLFAVLDAPAGPVALAVEVDLGTESLKVLRAKLATYAWLTLSREGLFGWPEFAVCIALRQRGRIPFMRELLADSWSERSFLWCLEDGPEEGLSRLAVVGTAPLTDSPCSKGRVAGASHALPMQSGDQEQGL